MSKIEENWYKLIGYLEGRKEMLDALDNSSAQIRKEEIDEILFYIKRISQ